MWTPAQGLAYARQMPEPAQRVLALAGLVPHLPKPLQAGVLQEALLAARTIKDIRKQVGALVELVPHLAEPQRNEVLREVLTAAREIEVEENKAAALIQLIPHLDDRTQALAELAPHVPQSLRDEILEAVRAAVRVLIQVRDYQAKTLSTLAPQLAELPPGNSTLSGEISCRYWPDGLAPTSW